jgi:hypothetical protein
LPEGPGDPQVQALWSALLLFEFLPAGFSNRNLREHLAPLLGRRPTDLTQGQMTYQLRRLPLHGVIERIPKTHRYRLTDPGLRLAWFFSRVLSHPQAGARQNTSSTLIALAHFAAASTISTAP